MTGSVFPRNYFFSTPESGKVVFDQLQDGGIIATVHDSNIDGTERITQIALDNILVEMFNTTQKSQRISRGENANLITTFAQMPQAQIIAVLQRLAPNRDLPGLKIETTDRHNHLRIYDPT